MSRAENINRMASDANYEPKNCYIIAQVAHIVCKKDHHEILPATVSEHLSAAYETLQASSLVFVKELGEKRVMSYYTPRIAYNACIERDLEESHGIENSSVMFTEQVLPWMMI